MAGPRRRLAVYRLAQERRDILRVLTGLVERRLQLMRRRKLIGDIKRHRRLSLMNRPGFFGGYLV